MGSEGEARGAAGNINEPSADELVPLGPEELFLAQQSSPVFDPMWNTGPNPATPQRDANAPPPTQPDSKALRVDT